MLTKEGCAARRKRLWDAIPEPLGFVEVSDPQSLIYFANYAPSPFEFRSSDALAFLILERDKATLVTDSMMRPYLDRAHVDEVVAPVWYDGRHSPPPRKAHIVKVANDVLNNTQKGKIGIPEPQNVPKWAYEGGAADRFVVWDGMGDIVRRLRRAKDPDEIALIRRSIHAGEAGHAAALENVKPGMTELDVFRIVQDAATEAAGEPVIVYGDFASGPRCATDRGGPPTARVIEAGDLFLLDFSVIVHGYRADFTNTFAVGRAPTSRQRDHFAACIEALTHAERLLKPGVSGRAVDEAVRGHFAAIGLADARPSHSGHGLGLSHPEPPFLVQESDDTLAIGDVVAVEPGLYVPEVGGMRVEHNYLITASGFERLTHHRLTLEAVTPD